MKEIVPFLIILVVGISQISSADFYKWTDENGIIHFSDSPNSIPEDADKIIEDKKSQTWRVIKPSPPPAVVVPTYQDRELPKSQPRPYNPPAVLQNTPAKTPNINLNPAKSVSKGVLNIYPIILLFAMALFGQHLLRQETNKRTRNRYRETEEYKDNGNVAIDHEEEIDLPYSKKKYIQTRAENNFYSLLCRILKDKYEIHPQIQLSKIVYVDKKGIKEGTRAWHKYHNKIDRKSLDYVICDKQTKETLLVIELDDSSHNLAARKERDAFVDEVLQIANIPILHIKTQYEYDEHNLNQAISTYIEIDPFE